MSDCFPLTSVHRCGRQFHRRMVSLKDVNITNESDFTLNSRSRLEGGEQLWNIIRSKYNCQNPMAIEGIHSLRYQNSYFCAIAAQGSHSKCSNAEKPKPFVLCLDECLIAYDTLSDFVRSCMPDDRGKHTIAEEFQFCKNCSDTNCQSGLSPESTSCGFSKLEAHNSFCKQNINQSCCYTKTSSFYTESLSTEHLQFDSLDSLHDGSAITRTVTGIVGGIVAFVLIVFAVAFVTLRNKNLRRDFDVIECPPEYRSTKSSPGASPSQSIQNNYMTPTRNTIYDQGKGTLTVSDHSTAKNISTLTIDPADSELLNSYFEWEDLQKTAQEV